MSTIYAVPFGPAVNNSAAENTLLPTALLPGGVLPADFAIANTMMRFTLLGNYTTTGAPTLTIRVKVGSTCYGWMNALTMPLNISANRLFRIDVLFAVSADGASGSGSIEGTFTYYGTLVTSLLAAEIVAGGTALDTTVSNAIDVTAQWGTANVSNSIGADFVLLEYVSGVGT